MCLRTSAARWTAQVCSRAAPISRLRSGFGVAASGSASPPDGSARRTVPSSPRSRSLRRGRFRRNPRHMFVAILQSQVVMAFSLRKFLMLRHTLIQTSWLTS